MGNIRRKDTAFKQGKEMGKWKNRIKCNRVVRKPRDGYPKGTAALNFLSKYRTILWRIG